MSEKAAYGRVFKKARRSKDKLFTVLYCNTGARQARLGLAISKKNCRQAVGRNRLKRIVRESFRRHQKGLKGIDIVVLNQANTHKAANGQLFDSLAGHWQVCEQSAGTKRDKG